jgi:putative ABC transport system permease protein
MAILHRILGGLKALFRTRKAEQELNEELRAYFESAVAHHITAGMTREEAELAARREMGSLEAVKEAVRDAGWESHVETLKQDLRYGARLLRRRPGFTGAAILALALGIGANTAIFSVVNSVLIVPLPFEHPEQLVMVWEKSPQTGATNVVNPLNFLTWRERSHSFQSMAALIAWHASLAGEGEPEKVENMYVSAGFFETLGVRPILGRWLIREEDLPGADHVAVLGEGLWRRRYGADPGIVGRTIRVDNDALKVVGVMPVEFRFPFSKAELWQPLAIDQARAAHSGRYLSTIARLKRGVTKANAQAEITLLASELQRERPDLDAKWGATVVGLREQMVGDVRTPLLILLGAVVMVLLIACANVSNLILMRDTSRKQEIAVRGALGASRWRLGRQFFVENALLAGIGGGAGFFLGWASKGLLIAALPDTIQYSNLQEIRVDSTVFLFAAAISIAAAVLFGLTPALRASAESLQPGLKETARGSSASRSHTKNALVVAEVALAMMLSVGAGLLIRSFARLSSVNPGFEASHILSMEINTAGYFKDSDPRFLQFCSALLERVRALPGVSAAGTSHFLPLGKIIPGTGFWRADRAVPARGTEPVTEVLVVMPGYFAAMDIPVIRGRVFSADDRKDSLLAVVVNDTLARSFYPGENPIGKSLAIEWGPDKPYQIVGVVGDVHQTSMQEAPKPGVFISNLQLPSGPLNLVVRSRLNPLTLAHAIKREVHLLNGQIAVSNVRTMDEYVSEAIAEPRFNTVLLGGFSTLALALAVVGIFGVISYSVTQRTRELAIRHALGADAGGIVRLVLLEGMRPSLLGIVVGGLLASGFNQFLRKLLYDVAPTDSLTFGGVTLLLCGVSLAACYIPARRAAQLDPIEALRME